MARPLRIEYPGAWYHVMNRGVRRRLIFNTTRKGTDFFSRAIADEFGLSSYASAGATIGNIRRRLAEDKGLRKDLMYILQDLTPFTR